MNKRDPMISICLAIIGLLGLSSCNAAEHQTGQLLPLLTQALTTQVPLDKNPPVFVLNPSWVGKLETRTNTTAIRLPSGEMTAPIRYFDDEIEFTHFSPRAGYIESRASGDQRVLTLIQAPAITAVSHMSERGLVSSYQAWFMDQMPSGQEVAQATNYVEIKELLGRQRSLSDGHSIQWMVFTYYEANTIRVISVFAFGHFALGDEWMTQPFLGLIVKEGIFRPKDPLMEPTTNEGPNQEMEPAGDTRTGDFD